MQKAAKIESTTETQNFSTPFEINFSLQIKYTQKTYVPRLDLDLSVALTKNIE
jgi:hypothetical protein